MESTGEYWKPIYNILEGNFTIYLVNAKHVKHVPARKTDVKDAEWLAKLMQLGLLNASFIPEKPQRDLRDLTRERKALIRERTRIANRIQKVLENANIKLSSVASDILGVSGRKMLQALVDGETEAERLAELAKGRLRNKLPELRRALTGRVNAHHRFLLAQHLAHIDFIDEQIAAMDAEIIRRIEAMSETSEDDDERGADGDGDTLTWRKAVDLLDTIPGVDRRAAEMILAEIGIDMSRFPSASHLAAWAGVAPGNHQSGGKHYSGRTKKGNKTLRSLLTQVAWAAKRTKNTYLAALYRRIAARRGKKRATIAVAHSILVSIYYMLLRQQPYQYLGDDYFDRRRKESKIDYLTRQLRKLGYQVQLDPLPIAA
jgi:transposase